ncbi:MAG: efflux RND transporter permease subunit, partial [Planctomycetes bacterium]|nr:efflux RND transporter permease subunit [Planctomycetota bacterium]
MNSLIRFSLNNRLLVVALSLVVLVLGTLTMTTLPIDIFPSLTRPRVVIMTECPGLAPEEVETLVTQPLETSINGARGVQVVRSSSGIGLSVIYVEFDWSFDIDLARQIVNERLTSAASSLPEGVKPEPAPIGSIMGQIMMVGMYSRDGTTPPMDVRTLADWTVRHRLRTISGVAQVISMGGGRKQFQVLVDPHRLLSFHVTLSDVEAALRQANQNSTGGFLERNDSEFLVRGIGRSYTINDLEMTVVRADSERSVLLRDVARVTEGIQAKRGDCSVDGRPAVVLTIAKQPNADTRKLTDDIEKA